MSNEAQTEQGQLNSNPKIAFSEKLEDLRAALNVLYISKNPSGRNKFREKWPQVAAHLFGEQLISFDNEGTLDFEARQKLEEESELRRIEFKNILLEFESKSVDSGFLKIEYIGSLIDKLGLQLAVLLYAERVIERARPGLLPKSKLEPVAKVTSAVMTDSKLTQNEVEILKNKPNNQPTKPLPPKGTLKTLFNWKCAHGTQIVKTA